jgi:urea carboxylase
MLLLSGLPALLALQLPTYYCHPHTHTHTPPQTVLLQVRLNGENPAKDFQPCPGVLGEVVFPTQLDGVRVDSWVESGTEISPYYDSLLGKLMVHAPTRELAVAKIQQALAGV